MDYGGDAGRPNLGNPRCKANHWSSSVEEQLTVLGFAGPPTVSFSCFRSGETAQFKLGASSPPTI